MPTFKSYRSSRSGTTRTNRTSRNRFRTATGAKKRSTTASKSQTTYSVNSPKFSPVKSECQWRIGSYKNVYSQISGAGSKTIFSPSTANKWIRFVNNGTKVYKFTNQQFARAFGAQTSRLSPTTCVRALQRKFGAGIKSVTRGKGSCWLVAATSNVNSGPFRNYAWK